MRSCLSGNILEHKGCLSQCVAQEVVNIALHLFNLINTWLDSDGERNGIANMNCGGLDVRDVARRNGLALLIAGQRQFVEVEAALVDKQGENVTTSLQFCCQLSVHRLPIRGTTRLGNIDIVGEECHVVEAEFNQMESTAFSRCCYGSVERIHAVFCYINSVVHPSTVLGGR